MVRVILSCILHCPDCKEAIAGGAQIALSNFYTAEVYATGSTC